MDYDPSPYESSSGPSRVAGAAGFAEDPQQLAPIVPVAAAPKSENLYEALLQYHNENDDSTTGSTESSRARQLRRAKNKVAPWTGDPTEPDAEEKSVEDRKLPAKPTSQPRSTGALKSPPSPPSASRSIDPSLGGGRLYPSVLESILPTETQGEPRSASQVPPGPRPGISYVKEPAIRPDSAMYQAAYGDIRDIRGISGDSSVVSYSSSACGTGGGTIQSTVTGGVTMGTMTTMSYPSQRTPTLGGFPPQQRDTGLYPAQYDLPRSTQRLENPQDRLATPMLPDSNLARHMMNIGNDEHIGLPVIATNNSATPPSRSKSNRTGNSSIFGGRIFGGRSNKRNQNNKKNKSESEKKFPGGKIGWRFNSEAVDASLYASTHTIMTTQDNDDIQHKSNPMQPYRQQAAVAPTQLQREHERPTVSTRFPAYPNSLSGTRRSTATNNRSPHASRNVYPPFPDEPAPLDNLLGSIGNDDTVSMDDDLRLALEISKRDTGPPPPTANPDPGPHSSPPPAASSGSNAPRALSGLSGKPAMQKQSSFLLSAMKHAREQGNSQSSLADLMLALKLSAEESAEASGSRHDPYRMTTNLDELLAIEIAQQSGECMTDFVAAGITEAPTSSLSHVQKGSTSTSGKTEKTADQLRILQQIREEKEKRELELALKESEKESKKTGNYHYHAKHQKALETEIARKRGSRPLARRENSLSSIDSEGRRRELMQRGTSETKLAMQKGEAHSVTCHGCQRRLQAPKSYSLVYCPNCQTISPVM